MLKYIKGKIKWGIALFVLIPCVVYALTTIPIFPSGQNNDWAGFWGGYLGAIFGGLITLFVLFKTIENENNQKKKEEDTQYFNKLLEVFSKLFSISNMFEAEVMRYVYQRANPKMTVCSVTEIRSFISEIERLGFELDMFLKIRKDDFQGIEELNSGIKKVVNSAKQAYSWFEMNLKTHGIPFLENDELCKMNLKLSELTKELSGSKEKLEKIISAYYNQ